MSRIPARVSFLVALLVVSLLVQESTSFLVPQKSTSVFSLVSRLPLVEKKLIVSQHDRKRTVRFASLTGLPASSDRVSQDDDNNNDVPTGRDAQTPGSKLRQLKELLWVRETLEDLTAAEFACSVEASEREVGRPASKRAVDYEKLLVQLNKIVRDMGCPGDLRGEVTCTLEPGVGKGSIVYTDKQRDALLERILRTRQLLLEVIQGHEVELDEELLPFSISLPEIRMELPREEDPTSPGPKLYVRDDGTVDWDGALQDQAALRKFGTAVWARINGRDPESIDEDGGLAPSSSVERGSSIEEEEEEELKEVTARIEETPQIKESRDRLDLLSKELKDLETTHTQLLSSAISAGQAVANVNLATLPAAERNRIRESAEAIEKMKGDLSFQTLNYELERIYTYLVRELGNPALKGYVPLQDRLNVAEFGLLESQIDNLHMQLDRGESLDADVLKIVVDQLTDFKRRLGIDYYVTGLSFDWEAIQQWLGELSAKMKKGLSFYGNGLRLFWNDVLFSLSLINRSAQGYTLKPREVRTIRYVNKDGIHFSVGYDSFST